ncbi:DNA repair REX1-B-domain-containing protein [Halteromyces radiatus]|uniref:DNA repair REX1-B-domain-containing protein n=1 Tax=Halteromyces radiatus TaxID=101107 RepID=UPI00221EB5E3|nr:DNA repair REX1-B-domain-containing protein [Halteromyces radiatus]KAI8100020.1 DNA repair REX1-B-domain-containing protein [Halteromyces radiatus]
MTTCTRDVLSRLQALSKAQETRIALYQEFDDAYQDYLQNKCPTEQFYSICGIVTEGFQEVSLEIQAIEKELSEKHKRSDLSILIRRLQQAEKDKLYNTTHLQIYTIKSRKEEKDYDTTIQETKQRLQDAVNAIQEVWDEIRQEITDLTYAAQ